MPYLTYKRELNVANSKHTHTQSEYYNPRAHARRALNIMMTYLIGANLSGPHINGSSMRAVFIQCHII